MTITLLGEVHGTKETPSLARKYFQDADTICLEIPSDQQAFIDENRLEDSDFFNRQDEDGRSTKEYQQLVQELIDEDKRIVCVDVGSLLELLLGRDKQMAKNIAKATKGKTVALLGSLHAAKKPLWIGLFYKKPAGHYLAKTHDVRSIALHPSSGKIHNRTEKPVGNTGDMSEYFDEVIDIGHVTPATPQQH